MKTKEAIERVRSRFNKWALDDEDLIALQTLGLADVESEDEKIRKELLAVIDDLVLPDEQKARFNAYLEKQKERKPVDVSEKIEELCSKFPLNKDVMSEQELSAYHQGLSFGATMIAEYLEPKKEQYDLDVLEKHITKDSISELAHTVIIRNGWDIVEQEQKPADYDYEMWKNCEVNFEGGKKEVINNPGKYGLCKPSEWSNEEKGILLECISALQNSSHWVLADKLSSLRPQPKQECESIDVFGSIKFSRIKTLENIISYFKYERKATQEEINTSFIPCLEGLLKDVENTKKPSEWDDKIRKELWEYFHQLQLESDKDFSPDFTIDDVLEWLENH